MDEYWTLKKVMAPGSEPAAVTAMISALRPDLLGVTMAGAGGGGFMYVLTKQPHQREFVEQTLKELKVGRSSLSIDLIINK